MKTLIGQPAGTALVSGSKICLVLEYGGYLAAMGLTATALEVPPVILGCVGIILASLTLNP